MMAKQTINQLLYQDEGIMGIQVHEPKIVCKVGNHKYSSVVTEIAKDFFSQFVIEVLQPQHHVEMYNALHDITVRKTAQHPNITYATVGLSYRENVFHAEVNVRDLETNEQYFFTI